MVGNIIAIAAIVLLVGGALAYIIYIKAKGQKCVGCPYAKQCGSRNSGCGGGCSCDLGDKTEHTQGTEHKNND